MMPPHAALHEYLRDVYDVKTDDDDDQPDQQRPRLTNDSDFAGVEYVAWGTTWFTKAEFIESHGADTGDWLFSARPAYMQYLVGLARSAVDSLATQWKLARNAVESSSHRSHIGLGHLDLGRGRDPGRGLGPDTRSIRWQKWSGYVQKHHQAVPSALRQRRRHCGRQGRSLVVH